MTELDHRPFAIPLFLLGAALLAAGLVGLVVDAATTLETNNPGGAAATGAILLFGAVAVTALLHGGSSVAERRARTVPGAGALALVLILVAAIAGGSALGAAAETVDGVGAAGVAGDAAATAGAALDVETFSGSLQGVAAPGPLAALGGAGSASVSHDATLPAGARNVRVELHWDVAATGGADALELRVETAEGEVLGSASGAPGLTLDVEDVEEGAQLRVVVSLTGPSAGQDYEAYLSSFAGEIPADHTAHES